MRNVTLAFLRSCCIEDADCWIWNGHATRHRTMSAWIDGKCVSLTRYAYALLHGEAKTQECVWRTCERRTCLNPKHLATGTRAQMMAAYAAAGRLKGRARRHPHLARYKMTYEKACEVRELAAQGVRQVDIAERIGITQQNVSLIVSGKSWREGGWGKRSVTP